MCHLSLMVTAGPSWAVRPVLRGDGMSIWGSEYLGSGPTKSTCFSCTCSYLWGALSNIGPSAGPPTPTHTPSACWRQVLNPGLSPESVLVTSSPNQTPEKFKTCFSIKVRCGSQALRCWAPPQVALASVLALPGLATLERPFVLPGSRFQWG